MLPGAHARAGFEDNLCLARDVPTPGNAALVAMPVRMSEGANDGNFRKAGRRQ